MASKYGSEGGVEIPDAPTQSWEDQYANAIGIPNTSTSPWNNASSPTNSEIQKSIDPNAGGLGDIISNMFTDKSGNLNLGAIGGIGGGILGALGAMSPNTKRSGYQGSIPKYEAVRNMVTAPPTREQGYRPGQGGINYGGDVTYTPKAPTGVGSGGSGGSSGGGSSALGNIAKVAGGAGLAALLGNYLSKSGGSGDLASIIKRLSGATTGGGLEKMPKITDFVSKRIGDAGGSGELTTPGGEYAGGDEFAGIDARIRNNEMALQEPPMLNDAEVEAEFDRLRGEMPTYTEFPSYDWGSGITMDDPYDFLGFAKGGSTGRYLQGETDGMADKIPAKIGRDQPAALSHGEFVVPADVVSHLGNGNSDAGAKKLYSMMDKIRQARTGTKKQGKQINPDKFMPGGLAQAYASGGSVQRFNTGGAAVSGLGTAANAGVTGSETGPNTWAGEYMSDMLGKGQALASAPYQQYMGPLTAGESGLQSKVYGGLQNINFPGNLGASFSSAGAYQPPAMNMGAYQQTPIGTGNYTRPSFEQYTSTLGAGQEPAVNKDVYDAGLAGNQIYNAAQPPMMLNQGSNGFGDFGSNQIIADLQNQGPAQRQTYEDYLKSQSMLHSLPQTREQFEQNQNQIQKMRDQGMGMLGRGDMSEIMAGLGGKPGQMPQGGLAGLAGRMQQPQPSQPQQEAQQQAQQPQNIAQQYMNPYLQSVLQPQMEEMRRQAQINAQSGLGALTKSGAFGGGRQAIMESEAGRNLLAEQNKAIGQGYASAFDRAQSQFNTEQNQGMGLARLMSEQGAQQRGIEAEGIAADKAAFEAARENPYKMLQFQQSLLQGMPISATNIDMATPSKTAEVLSGIGGGIKYANTLPSVSKKSVTDLLGNLGLSSGG